MKKKESFVAEQGVFKDVSVERSSNLDSCDDKAQSISRTKNWIKEGAEVCHKDDITTKMYVDRILKKVFSELTGYYYDKDQEVDGKKHIKGEPIKEERIRICGVSVHWYDKERKLKTFKFHTRELVPWEVGLKGTEAVIFFLSNKV